MFQYLRSFDMLKVPVCPGTNNITIQLESGFLWSADDMDELGAEWAAGYCFIFQKIALAHQFLDSRRSSESSLFRHLKLLKPTVKPNSRRTAGSSLSTLTPQESGLYPNRKWYVIHFLKKSLGYW
jgi:hypothetical protein